MNQSKLSISWKTRGLTWVLVAVSFLAGCQIFEESAPDANWQERELSAASENVVWQVVVRSLRRLGYPLGSGLDPDSLVAETGWRRSLAPFRGKGYQLRATVKIDVLGSDRYLLKVRVQRQDNMTLVNPADPRYAEWEWRKDDVVEAKILIQHFRTYLDPAFEVSTNRR